jgi:disulfide bond formation protein DsbB
MNILSIRAVAVICLVAAAAALGVATLAEQWEGLAPCALCLLERWPYRLAIVLGLAAALAPRRYARALLALLAVTVLADAAIAAVHVGVEFRWWPSPMPECAAPRFTGGSIAERLASMPARPAKPCDDPSFPVPGLPLSLAEMNLLFALMFGGAAAVAARVSR